VHDEPYWHVQAIAGADGDMVYLGKLLELPEGSRGECGDVPPDGALMVLLKL